MASKDEVGEKTKSPSEEIIESWASRQIEYLVRRRAAFKGVVTKNSKKAKDIISKNGSRTVLRSVKERVLQALQDASKTTQDVLALQSDDVIRRAETEEWLDSLRSEVDDIVDSVEEYLESRADESPSVIGEISFVADAVDDKESRNSDSSDDSQVVKSAQKFVELLSKSTQSKGNKSAPKLSNKNSDSDESGSEEDELDKGRYDDSKDFDRLFKGIKKPALTVFSGDKDLYHDWKAQFEIFVDRMKVPAKTKMMMLKNSLFGKPLRIVERLGYTSRQYQTALEKLDQKYGGEKRLLQRHLEAILRASPVGETNLKELEIFSDRLTDVVVKLEDSDQHQELAGISALYIAVQQKLPGSLLIAYQEWLHREPRKDGLSVFSKWLQKQVVYRMDVEEVKERTKKKTEDNIESKKHKRDKGAVHNVTRELTPKCVVCHGPHQITSCKNWGEASIANRWEIAKKNELCYRCLRSGHQGKNCPENNRCGINDCKGTHHFHLHFERRSKPPEQVDAAVETRCCRRCCIANSSGLAYRLRGSKHPSQCLPRRWVRFNLCPR